MIRRKNYAWRLTTYKIEASNDNPKKELCLALDDIQDPGNLGTIIRIADWFGIKNIYCSHGTADAFSPKTVQATMGALARVKIHYCDIKKLISDLDDVPVFGTFLDGNNIYESELSANGLIVMGNEGQRGIGTYKQKNSDTKLSAGKRDNGLAKRGNSNSHRMFGIQKTTTLTQTYDSAFFRERHIRNIKHGYIICI